MKERQTEYKIMHYGLLVLILFLFSQFTIDAIIFGALLIYVMQRNKT
jgi:hypothetical protein